MTAANQDATTGDEAGGVAGRIKDYCDRAVAHLKAGRLGEAYLYANEALDGKDAKAGALRRYVLYVLLPKRRLLDKATALHEEAWSFSSEFNHDKAVELLSLAKKWHCTPEILYAQFRHNMELRRYDQAYVNVTETIAGRTRDVFPYIDDQMRCLRNLGFKVLPKMPPRPQVDRMPDRYRPSNWPKALQIGQMDVLLHEGHAQVKKSDGEMLKPLIPLDQLARFLNEHVQGAPRGMGIDGCDERTVGEVLRLLDEVTVPGRLHTQGILSFTNFFRLPWASMERIFDGRTLRGVTILFFGLQLASGVDSNELFKLPAVRYCSYLIFQLHSPLMETLPGPPPLYDNTALMEWTKGDGRRVLAIASDYLASGLLSFLDALKEDFRQATQVCSTVIMIQCPNINDVAGLGVRKERLSNRLGERMTLEVGETATTQLMGRRCETVTVKRRASPR